MNLFSNPIALSIIGSDSHVLYACECKEFKPITKLYFCRHCTKLRCGNCVTHEVDSFYCPNCLENMPSAEAKLKKNRCGNCFDCPSCHHTLSVRATAVPAVQTNPLDGKTPPLKKVHYLNCGFCRWTTRDVKLPDQLTPSGGWPAVEPAFSKKMSALLDYYKHMAHQDKMEKERQKLSKRRTNMYLMDRYGYALSLGKRRAGSIGSPLSILSRTSSSPGSQKEVQAPCLSPRLEEIEPIPDRFYTEEVVLEEVLTLEQRLHQPSIQGEATKTLYPQHKHLMVRRSQRCKECEHNLCKPEFNPSSIKFKIQLGGIHYCPSIQIFKKPNLSKDMESVLILSISNPLDTIMNVSFENLSAEEQELHEKNCEIELPKVILSIAAKDATVEFDGIGSATTDNFNDDPSVVHSRASNKVCFFTKITPKHEQGEVAAFFKMTYEYKMTTAPLVRKLDDADKSVKLEEHLVSLTVLVRVMVGEINQTLC
ncbi:dynactin subunit 4-like [Hydractinia symbiolongicarpus]|uniref:dynactin subunit 4-like n=1 Tax=Hydractinia symbiolongicarpus TaxID=13093 RepID=UPI00255105E5|nr:dynactin subunit 4-like [Hydractinia symbiolongicarpus]XP_057308866.1 dynactin subunit 4-like [Hydractinia symbiolongicarpus]XP_057308867.1 dynactin subunit 4-like [Hydractinia symbiolongicarpus]